MHYYTPSDSPKHQSPPLRQLIGPPFELLERAAVFAFALAGRFGPTGAYMTLETIAPLSDDPIVKLPAMAA